MTGADSHRWTSEMSGARVAELEDAGDLGSPGQP